MYIHAMSRPTLIIVMKDGRSTLLGMTLLVPATAAHA